MNIKLTPHEEKILELVQQHPEIIDSPEARKKIAEQEGLSEKTLRNRIADLKKYGVISNVSQTPTKNNADELTLFQIINIMWSFRFKVMRNLIIVTVIAVTIVMLMPLTYRSTAIIMPPKSESGLNISSALSSLPFGNILGTGGDSKALTFLAILKSRKIQLAIIKKFNLENIYNTKFIEDAIEELNNNTSIEIEEEGTIKISFTAKTPWFHREHEITQRKELVKNVTNHYVKLLDNVNRELNSETAVNHRKFIEERYYLNKEELRLAEKALNKFQNEHNAIALENQTSAAIDIAAAIKSTLMTNQVKIEIMQQTLPEDHPDLANLQKENRLLQEQLDQLNTGKESDFLLPKFDQMSDLGMEYVRLSRDVEVQNQIFIFLTQQYEEAKISEAKDTPTLQVLDFGDIPEKKYKPARGRICIVVFILTLIGSLYYYYGKYRWAELSE